MSLSVRAKQMLMGDLYVGQFCFESTDTMLPKKHSNCMEGLLKLFGNNILVIDVATGSKRAALGLLVRTANLNSWVPDRRYIIQTATVISGEYKIELISTDNISTDTWALSVLRTHELAEFPKKHMSRIAKLADSDAAFQTIWESMSLVFIWEKVENDDLPELINYVTQIV